MELVPAVALEAAHYVPGQALAVDPDQGHPAAVVPDVFRINGQMLFFVLFKGPDLEGAVFGRQVGFVRYRYVFHHGRILSKLV